MVRFFINIKRGAVPEKKVDKAKDIVSVAMDGLMTIFGDTTYVSTLVADCYVIAQWLLNHEHETEDHTISFMPALQYGAFAVFTILTVVDAYVHYMMYSNSRHKSAIEKEVVSDDTPLLDKGPTFAMRFLAGICAFMCATEAMMVPSVVMTLLNHFNMASSNIPFRIVRTALNIAAAGLSFWSSDGKYQLAVTNVQEYYEHRASSPIA